jgi:hypothetical protein
VPTETHSLYHSMLAMDVPVMKVCSEFLQVVLQPKSRMRMQSILLSGPMYRRSNPVTRAVWLLSQRLDIVW